MVVPQVFSCIKKVLFNHVIAVAVHDHNSNLDSINVRGP